MSLYKTEKARAALAAGKAGAVDLRDRRVLILADGQRTRAALVAMLGADCAASIDRLVREGYLASNDAHQEVVAPTSMPAPIVAPQRRSLVAAKMYLVDMLQLQRSPEAVELRLAIQSTSDQGRLRERLFDAVEFLVGATSPSYGERIRTRFVEVLPEA